MNNLPIFQYYVENNNFFNYLFLITFGIIIILISIYWFLSYNFYIKTKDNTVDPHLISELKAPSKLFFLILLSIISCFIYIFSQFTFANYHENLNSFKYLIVKDNNLLFSNSKNISHTMDITIPLENLEQVYVNDFKYAEYKNLHRDYCQISLKIKNTDKKIENKEKLIHNDLINTFTLTIPKDNLIKKSPCIDVAKDMTHFINKYKDNAKLEKIGLMKTSETKPIFYVEHRKNSLYILYGIRLITKPGSLQK